MDKPDQRDREIETLQESLSRLSEASRRINVSLELDHGLRDSARSRSFAGFTTPVPADFFAFMTASVPTSDRGLHIRSILITFVPNWWFIQ